MSTDGITGNPSDGMRPIEGIKEAFGWSDDYDVPPSVKLGISNATDTLANLRGAISQGVTNQWASAALATDQLAGKIAYAANNAIASAADTARQLQHPIAVATVSALGSALEASMPLGVVPPYTDGNTPLPPCVVIRQAAISGDLTPALEVYNQLAFPQRFTRGQQYVDTISYITNCLPPDGTLRNQFADAVLRLQSQPDYTPAAMPGGSLSDALQTGSAAGNQIGSQSADAGTMPPEYGAGVAYSGAGTNPGTAARAGTIASIGDLAARALQEPVENLHLYGPEAVQGSGPPPYSPPVYQAPFPNAAPFVPVRYGGPATGVQPGSGAPPPAPPFVPVSAPSGGLPPGAPAGSLLPSGTIPGSGAPRPGAPLPLAPTPVTTLPPGYQLPPGATIGSGPPPGFETPPTSGGTPGTQPPPYGSTFRPETPTKPATPTTPPPCIKLCPPEGPTCQYTVWCDRETKVAYVLKAGDKPNRSSDYQLVSGDPAGWDLAALISACMGAKPQPQQPPAPSGPVGGFAPFAKGCLEFAPTAVATGINVGEQFLYWIGLQDQGGNPTVPFPDAGPLDIGKNLVNGLLQILNTQLNSVIQALGAFLSNTPCGGGEQLGLLATAELIGTIERWLGWDLSQLRIPNEYQRNFNCPQRIPAPGEIAQAWLANEINNETRDCWLRANNVKPDLAMTWIGGSRTKLSPVQNGALLMRDKIDRPTFEQRIRESGMIRQSDPQDILDLLKQIPGPGDIVQLMVRDAADTVNIDWSKEDALFPQKYTGQLKDWGKNQGLDDEYMKEFWRAHFSIPAPGQLSEMLHRLSRLPPGDPAYVDLATVRNALIQQDISPKWVDQFVAISYRPLSRRDASQAFRTGVIDKAGVVDAYLELGYDQKRAQTLADFQERAANLLWQNHAAVKLYAKGEINDSQLTSTLFTAGATDAGVELARQRAYLLGYAQSRKLCVDSYKTRYLTGDLDLSEVQQQLGSLGLDASQTIRLTDGWQCQKAARGKAIPAGELCKMYALGGIDFPTLTQRLQRVGYSYDDSILMARRCATTTQQKVTADEAKRAKQQEAEQIKQAKALEKAANAQSRAFKNAQQMAQRAKDVAVAREKRLIEAGSKFQKNSGLSLPDAIIAVKTLYNQFLNKSQFTQDEIINALLVVSANTSVTDLSTLTADTQTALSA